MDNSIITGFFSITGLVVGFYFARKKYMFEKIYEQKLMCIIDLYKQVVRLEFEIKRYVNDGGDIYEKTDSLNRIKRDFQKFQHKFWEIEIILDESIIEKINKFRIKYIEITSKLSRSNNEQNHGARNESLDSWDESFELISSDLPEIKNNLKEEFRKTLKIKS